MTYTGTEVSQLELSFIAEPGLMTNSIGEYPNDVEFEPIEKDSPTDVFVYIAPRAMERTPLILLTILCGIGAYVVLIVRFRCPTCAYFDTHFLCQILKRMFTYTAYRIAQDTVDPLLELNDSTLVESNSELSIGVPIKVFDQTFLDGLSPSAVRMRTTHLLIVVNMIYILQLALATPLPIDDGSKWADALYIVMPDPEPESIQVPVVPATKPSPHRQRSGIRKRIAAASGSPPSTAMERLQRRRLSAHICSTNLPNIVKKIHVPQLAPVTPHGSKWADALYIVMPDSKPEVVRVPVVPITATKPSPRRRGRGIRGLIVAAPSSPPSTPMERLRPRRLSAHICTTNLLVVVNMISVMQLALATPLPIDDGSKWADALYIVMPDPEPESIQVSVVSVTKPSPRRQEQTN